MTRHMSAAMFVIGAVTFIAGCGGKAPAPPTPTVNPVLDLQLASIPADFELVANQGDRLTLAPVDEGLGGRLEFMVGPEIAAVNVLAAVQAHQRRIEELPDGDYKGGQELITHIGPAYYSRGRFTDGDSQIEEAAVFVGHPSASRLLTISYRYPAGVDSSVRVQQLLEVLGEVEAIGAEPGSQLQPE